MSEHSTAPDTFDPATVPPFPVITLHRDEENRIIVNGRAVGVEPGENWHAAGVEAVANLAAEDGLPAVRVRAIDTPDEDAESDAGTEHRLIITAEGRAYPVDEEVETPAKRTLLTRKTLTAAIAGGAVVAIALAGALTFKLTHQPEPVATAWSAPRQGANIPVPVPDGYGQSAAWARLVDDRSTAVATGPHEVVVTGPDEKNLLGIDTRSGRTVWRGKGAPSGSAGLYPTTIGDTKVIATSSSTAITAWVLEGTAGAAAKAQEVALPSGSDVTFDGSTPLIDLGDQTAATITAKGKLHQVDVPVGAEPVLATSTAVIASDGDSWWRIDRDNTRTKQQLPHPSGTKGAAAQVYGLDNTHLLAVWKADRSGRSDRVGVIDLQRDEVIDSAAVDSSAVPSSADVLHTVSGRTVAVGDVVVQLHDDRAHIATTDDFTPKAISDTAVYGTAQSAPIAAALTGKDSLTGEPFPGAVTGTGKTSGTPVLPAVVNADGAFVVAPKVAATYLYKAPSIGASE